MNYLHSYHTVTDTGKNQRAVLLTNLPKEIDTLVIAELYRDR